ncbi:hypothetical protein FOZ62_001893, partial [Perkinsus olseni]
SFTSSLRGIRDEIEDSEDDLDDPVTREIKDCLEGLVRHRERAAELERGKQPVECAPPPRSQPDENVTELQREIYTERREKMQLMKKMRHLKKALDKLNLENMLLMARRGKSLQPQEDIAPVDEHDPHQECNETLFSMTERANMTILQMAQRNAGLRLENEQLRARISDLLSKGSSDSRAQRSSSSETGSRRKSLNHKIRRSLSGPDALSTMQRSLRASSSDWATFEHPRRYSQVSATTNELARSKGRASNTEDMAVSSMCNYGRERPLRGCDDIFVTPPILTADRARLPRAPGTTEPAPRRPGRSSPRLSRTEILENELRFANEVTRRAQEVSYDKLR